MSDRGRAPNWIILTALMSCSGVSILSTDLYTPSLPHLPALLDSTPSAVQLTMSLNLAAYAACQLFYGPLADRVGRIKLLTFGLVGFFLASLACAFAPNVETLIAARMVQGAFASAEAVVTMLLVRELFEGDEGTRAMGLFGMGLGAFPAIGPLLGGYIYVWAGWRANFVVMAIAILAFGILALKVLPETKVPDRDALNMRHIGRTYLSLLRDKVVLRYLIPLAALMAGLFAFITAGPFILIERMGVATEHYGLYYGIVVLSYIAGSYAVTRMVGLHSTEALAKRGLAILLIGCACVFALVMAGLETPITLVAALSIATFGAGLVFASAPLLVLDAAGDTRRGMASALLGFCQLGGASLGAFAVGEMHDGTAMPFAVVMLVSGLLGAAGFWGLRERR